MIKLIQILSEIKNISGTRPFFLGFRREGSNRVSLMHDPDYAYIGGDAVFKGGDLVIKTHWNGDAIRGALERKHIPSNVIKIVGKGNSNYVYIPASMVKIGIEYPTKVKIDKSKDETPLNLKIGKYNIDKGQKGYIIPWEEGRKNIDVRTLRRFEQVYSILGITPENIYISYDSPSPSTYCLGYYNGEPVICAQRQTEHPVAGQFYVYSKYARLSLTHPENGKLPDDKTTKDELLQSLKIPAANNP